MSSNARELGQEDGLSGLDVSTVGAPIEFSPRCTLPDTYQRPSFVRHASHRSLASLPLQSQGGSRHRSSTSASPIIRGIAIVPRRISGIVRNDSIGLMALKRVLDSSRPPKDFRAELDPIVEHIYAFVPKLVQDYSLLRDYSEIELLLLRKTRKFVEIVKSIGFAREEGLSGDDDTASEPDLSSARFSLPMNCNRATSSSPWKIRKMFSSARARSFFSKSVSATANSTPKVEFVLTPVFHEWLTEFLFIMWYSSLPVEQEESISNIRQACRQIVWRATASVTSIRDAKRNQFSCFRQSLYRLLPWRLRLFLGEPGPLGEKSWLELNFDPFDRERLRARMAHFHSHEQQPSLHWLTREFEDPSLEKSFQVDLATTIIGAPFWPFFLGLGLALTYVSVQYGLLHMDYPSVTLARLILTEPISWVIVFAVVQLVMHTVLFSDSEKYRQNFFLYQFYFALFVCCVSAVWMYEVRSMFAFVAWPLSEGYTMSSVLIVVTFLCYVRFILMVFLTVLTAAFTLILRVSVHESASADLVATLPLQQWLAIAAAVFIVLSSRYIFETHSRVDFILTRTLFAESERSDKLLRNILPEQVIQHLKDVDGEAVRRASVGRKDPIVGIAEAYDNVTILFADVCGFTTYSSHISPEELVLFLNELFTAFDDIAESAGLEKIKTIGDAYMAVAGLNHDRDPMHAANAARMGLRVAALMQSGQFRDHNHEPLGVRVGIHSGACVAGVIGRKKFIYDIWGDAVNTASRMESTGEVNMVHCSEETSVLLETAAPGEFEIVPRGEIDVKGKGVMKTFFVLSDLTAADDSN